MQRQEILNIVEKARQDLRKDFDRELAMLKNEMEKKLEMRDEQIRGIIASEIKEKLGDPVALREHFETNILI